MTIAELRYLIAIDWLCDGDNGVKLTEIAAGMSVTKVSVYHAVERLEKNGHVRRNEKNKVVMTESGKTLLEEYMVIVRFIRNHLEQNCGTPADTAYQDALGVACALSDISRDSIALCMKNAETEHKSS